jgi:hypothetical protein
VIEGQRDEIMIFSCFTRLYFFCQVDNIYLDGTFQYCKKFFLWLQKIVIMYLSFFLFVAKQNCFKPMRVVIDFEVAIHKAVGNVWPNVTVIGCKFHFTQWWFRKI